MDATAIVVAVIGSGILNTLLVNIVSTIKENRKNDDGVSKGLKVILKDRLRFLCISYINQGWIYEDELEDLINMHKSYKKLGGNGFLDELISKVSDLEIRGERMDAR